MTENRRDFDKEAATWDENSTRVKMAEDVSSEILKHAHLDRSSRVLDFGCGTGLVSLRLASWAGSLTGVDSSRGMLEVFQAKADGMGLANVRTQLLDPDRGGRLEGEFDLVVSSMALHHVKDIGPLLAQFHQCLVPGGWLCIADLDYEGGLFHTDNTGVFHFGFKRKALKELFAQAGFKDVQAVSATTVTRPDSEGQMRDFGIFLIKGRRSEPPN